MFWDKEGGYIYWVLNTPCVAISTLIMLPGQALQ